MVKRAVRRGWSVKWYAVLLGFMLLFVSLITSSNIKPILKEPKSVSISEIVRSIPGQGKRWEVTGILDGKSIYHQPRNGTINFRLLSQRGDTLNVIYKGPPLECLVDRASLMVAGMYTIEKVFVADTILAINIEQQECN